ncbi:MAG: type II toxin-antitoxin system HicB family antitoxin [Chloroflexota bacterium]|jgi:predicted RNase H-like HicB family nuclease
MQKQLTAIIERQGDGYVSLCPELDIASQGDTIEEARENLREALELFIESASPEEIQQRLHIEQSLFLKKGLTTHDCPHR